MAFVGKPFKHDVFVSYSHGDTAGKGDSLLSQWSQSFIRELEMEMQFHADAGDTSVFLDEHVRAGQALDPSMGLAQALKQHITDSAMMLVLMSPHYVRSEWCRQERIWWGETQGLHGLDPRSRLSYARLLPVEKDQWPKEFVDETGNPPVGHAFYDPAEDDPRPFNWPIVDHSAKEVRRVMIQLAGELRRKLKAVRKEIEDRERQLSLQANLTAATGQVVYLHGRQSDADDWGIVYDKLEGSGFGVVPAEPEPMESDPKAALKIRNERVQTMGICDAVLLLGTKDSSALTADLAVVGRLDRQQAIARFERPLPCGVVDTLGVVSSQPRWERMARSLGVQWLNAPLAELAPRLRDWLARAAA